MKTAVLPALPAGDGPVPPAASRWRVADLVLDTRRQRVWRGGEEIPLPKLTYDLFATLVHRWPDVIADEELMKAVWPGIIVSPETVSQRVKLLRAALGDESRTPRYVGRLRGRGYHLVATVEPADTGQPLQAEERVRPDEPPGHRDPAAPAVDDEVVELSLVESTDDLDQPAAPDWAVTQVLPLEVAAGIEPAARGAVAAVAVAPVAGPPPVRRQERVPDWLSWAIIGIALLVTGIVVAVLKAA